jgi:hypothetical protein
MIIAVMMLQSLKNAPLAATTASLASVESFAKKPAATTSRKWLDGDPRRRNPPFLFFPGLRIDNIDVAATVKKIQQLLTEEANLLPASRSTLAVLILVVQLLVNRLILNSRNSSQPPSKGRFPARDKTATGAANPPGGQTESMGHHAEKNCRSR